MTNRWSNARQGVIDTARASIISKGCAYAISELEAADKATVVGELLDNEVFHFGKGNLVSGFLMQTGITSQLNDFQGAANKVAPYQHPEIISCLSHFFKGRYNFGAKYPERFDRGKYGLQMPQAMVALIATAVS